MSSLTDTVVMQRETYRRLVLRKRLILCGLVTALMCSVLLDLALQRIGAFWTDMDAVISGADPGRLTIDGTLRLPGTARQPTPLDTRGQLRLERLALTYDDQPVELRRSLYRTEAHHYRNELN